MNQKKEKRERGGRGKKERNGNQVQYKEASQSKLSNTIIQQTTCKSNMVRRSEQSNNATNCSKPPKKISTTISQTLLPNLHYIKNKSQANIGVTNFRNGKHHPMPLQKL